MAGLVSREEGREAGFSDWWVGRRGLEWLRDWL